MQNYSHLFYYTNIQAKYFLKIYNFKEYIYNHYYFKG